MSTLFFSDELVSSLAAFATQQEKVVTPELLKIVENISKTGVVCYSWSTLRVLLAHLLNQALQGYMVKVDKEAPAKGDDEDNDIEKRSQRFIYALESFDEAPFTVQRLCELILSPEKTYSNYFKYISALEKMVNITSTLSTLTQQQIQTINQTGIIVPQNDDDVAMQSTNSNNSNNNNYEVYPTSMNVDLNGIQSSFPVSSSPSPSPSPSSSVSSSPSPSPQEASDNNNNNTNDEKNNNSSVNSESFSEEKAPTPMDM